MLRFIKKVFVVAMSFFSCNALKCVSMNNQECKVRPEIININSNEPLFCPYSLKISKCIGTCNNINDPYPKLCKNMNLKVFSLISRTNKTRYKNGMKLVIANVEQMQVFVTINKYTMKINSDVNAKD